jgi:glycerol-1-phosphate dehydrogenase [NAD(P)+]
MEIIVPSLLRIKPNALHKLGKYLRNESFSQIALFYGEGLKPMLAETVEISLASSEIKIAHEGVAASNDIEVIFQDSLFLPQKLDAIVAIGGGKVIDCCKYLALLKQIPLVSVPTLISNDGFSSPFSSLVVKGARRTVRTVIPHSVILDTEIIRSAPEAFFYSGMGDLFCKFTSVFDWKLAFKKRGEPVNDFAAMICLNAADTFFYYPNKHPQDVDFVRVVASSLMMAGIAMEIAGSSRPASGSEHLISHAYDRLAEKPSLHGLQVGAASYAVSHLQGDTYELLKKSIQDSGFLSFMEKHPLSRRDFIEAVKFAPSVKEDFYTVLSERGAIENLLAFIEKDELMRLMLA